MDKNEAINIAKKYSEAIISVFPIEKIILFGSYAKNEQRENSDIDVAVIVKNIKEDYLETYSRLFLLRNKIDFKIEPHLLKVDKDPSGFLKEIYKTGIVIYQKN